MANSEGTATTDRFQSLREKARNRAYGGLIPRVSAQCDFFMMLDLRLTPAPGPGGYGAVFKQKNMKTEIPLYVLRDWHRHLSRIVEYATCDPSDTRTANAMRLVRKDLRRMERYLQNKNSDDKT